MARDAPVVVLLREGTDDLATASVAMRLAGWTLIARPSVGDLDRRVQPRGGVGLSPSSTGTYVERVIADASQAEATLTAIATGHGAVVAAAADGGVWTRFARAASEVADVRHWETGPLAGLAPVQVELLAAIGHGEHMAAAARSASVSERSAQRQVGRAREHLKARSNGHAAVLVLAEVARLAPPDPG